MKFEFFRKNKEVLGKEKPKQEEFKPRIEGDFKPIRACIVDDNKKIDPQTKKTFASIEKNGEFVDFDADDNFYKQNNMRNAGKWTYAISECNDKDKYSKGYYNCTGVVIVGEEKESDKQISFMSHQNPYNFLENKKKKFTKDLTEIVKKIKSQTKEESLDVVIFGGKTGDYGDEYKESIGLISDIFIKELGFEPTVMTGPNLNAHVGSTRVYFDTQNRRLYIARPSQKSEVNESYLPSELKEKRKEWL